MPIQHRRVGKNGVIVSNLCLGTMNFGWKTSEKEAFRIMDKALDHGINFFDTADVYGGESVNGDFQKKGLTEEIIGKWFAQGGGRRDAVVLAAKVYGSVKRDDRLREPNTDGLCLSAMKIKKHCEDSLRRMQTEWIDLYQMHHIDRECPWSEIWDAMNSLRIQGKIVYNGSSNFAGWDIATANQEADKRGMHGLIAEQSIYSLVNRTIELEVIPSCKHYGMGIMPWSPLAGGILAGLLDKSKASGRRNSLEMESAINKWQSQLTQYEDLCKELGEQPATIGLAWLLHNPVVTAPIIGPRAIDQLDSAIRATEVVLDAATLNRLDEIFPGPGGEAPYAYAW
ncbi:aldo/keto reductase [Paucibacter sp. DJ2R-2]|uniref:aldo/keto reductase n=1 Tax=Paucibacter sp. DJ2R-2 TaxID=2893558 RepID=UPI0021E5158F|nr:aldo/keto reductase [Paucibacter sp. DJ2R-2]MCV2438645.1 aldo/keto reductase [Paucibacter sp. DJ2R-2]